MGKFILESRTPLSCSAWRISMSALMKPGCSSAWEIFVGKPLCTDAHIHHATYKFEVQFSLSSCIGIGIKSRLYAVSEGANVHLACNAPCLYGPKRAEPKRTRSWRNNLVVKDVGACLWLERLESVVESVIYEIHYSNDTLGQGSTRGCLDQSEARLPSRLHVPKTGTKSFKGWFCQSWLMDFNAGQPA